MAKRLREEDDVLTATDYGAHLDAGSPAKAIEPDGSDQSAIPAHTMQCLLPPHRPLSFMTATDFDVHYAKEHTNRCSSCGKNFPSAHYLTLHMDENHNPMREELAAKGEKTYACFIEDCEKICSTPQRRRLHLIDKHMFPKVYNFRIVDQGIDKTSSLLQGGQRRRLSTNDSGGHRRRGSLLPSENALSEAGQEKAQQQTTLTATREGDGAKDEQAGETLVDELEKSFAALKFVPPSVQARQRTKKP